MFAGECCAQAINWEIINRFRVVKEESANDRLISRLLALRNVRTYTPLLVPSRNDGRIGSYLNKALMPVTWDERYEQYDLDWIHNRERSIRVELKNIPKDASCKWISNADVLEGSSCEIREFKRAVGSVTNLRVEITKKGAVGPIVLRETIVPQDLLVAALGDSLGSGEGNPHLKLVPNRGNPEGPLSYPAIWWDTRCHRSLMSSSAQAAALLAERNTKQSVTYLSFSCSGAEIDEGILEEYAGRQTIAQTRRLWELADQPPQQDSTMNPNDTPKSLKSKLPSQINQLSSVLCPPKSKWEPSAECTVAAKLQPDVLIIAIGGNDIGFGEIGRKILLSNPPTDHQRWQDEQQRNLEPAFDTLSRNFAKLSEVVRQRIQAKRVFLLEYMDPTMYSQRSGEDILCGQADGGALTGLQKDFQKQVNSHGDGRLVSASRNHSLYNLLLTKTESRFAHWVVSRLNETIRQAGGLTWASEPNERATVVSLQDLRGPDGKRKGVCAADSWFLGIFDSLNRQDWIPSDAIQAYPLKLSDDSDCSGELRDGKCWVPAGNITSGILHPNFFGHYNAAVVILKQIEKSLSAN